MSEDLTPYGADPARDLLERRIKESGESQTRYALEELTRDPRTIRRWLAGDRPIPDVVLARLMRGPRYLRVTFLERLMKRGGSMPITDARIYAGEALTRLERDWPPDLLPYTFEWLAPMVNDDLVEVRGVGEAAVVHLRPRSLTLFDDF